MVSVNLGSTDNPTSQKIIFDSYAFIDRLQNIGYSRLQAEESLRIFFETINGDNSDKNN